MTTLPNQAPSPSCSERCPGFHQRGVPPQHWAASHRRLRWRALRPRAERSSGGGPDEGGSSGWERADHEREAERLFRSAQLQEQQRPGAEYGEVGAASFLAVRAMCLSIAAGVGIGQCSELEQSHELSLFLQLPAIWRGCSDPCCRLSGNQSTSVLSRMGQEQAQHGAEQMPRLSSRCRVSFSFG